MPPTKPSMVFLGLILINLVFPITLPIKYEKISKVIIIIIKRLNVKIHFSLLLFAPSFNQCFR